MFVEQPCGFVGVVLVAGREQVVVLVDTFGVEAPELTVDEVEFGTGHEGGEGPGIRLGLARAPDRSGIEKRRAPGAA